MGSPARKLRRKMERDARKKLHPLATQIVLVAGAVTEGAHLELADAQQPMRVVGHPGLRRMGAFVEAGIYLWRLSVRPLTQPSASARDLDRRWPAVERHLRRLAVAGLAEREGATWRITDHGRETWRKALTGAPILAATIGPPTTQGENRP